MSGSLKKPQPKKQVQLTARDQAVLWRAHEYRFITTNQIQRFTASKNRNKLNDRLRDLWAEDYLTRPEIQRQVYAYRETRETVHALGQRGAEWLAREHGVRFPKGKGFEAANTIKSGAFLEHEIKVGDIMLAFPSALAAYPGIRVLDQTLVVQETAARANRSLTYPLTLRTQVRWPNGKREEIGTKPDHTFFIIDGRGAEDRRALMFLEYENTKKDFAKILLKYLKYADVYQRRLHTERFGSKNFRVLIVINGDQDYLALFLAVYRQHIASLCPAGSFLHTTLADYEAAGPLAASWVDGVGQERSLIE